MPNEEPGVLTRPNRIPDLETLPVYNPQAHCPKCRHAYVSVRYVRVSTGAGRDPIEWLRRRCEQCAFIWDERVEDSDA